MENEYRTRDLSEASALIVAKARLKTIEREGHVCHFVFDDNQKRKELSNDFFFGELLVNAREYYEAMTRLKSRIFSK